VFLPGALLALLVTFAALFALVVVIAVNRGGPDRLWLGGGDGVVTLQTRTGADGGAGDRNAIGLPASAVSLLPGARSAGLGNTIALGAPAATAARPHRVAAPLRGEARVRRRAGHPPAAARPAPVATPAPAPATPSASPAAAPIAAPAPASTVVKSHGHGAGQAKGKLDVPKQRVKGAKPAPAPAPPPSAAPPPPLRAAPAPAPAPVEKHRTQPGSAPAQDDGGLKRVPPGGAKHDA
jgi:hypothetical protein